MVQRNPRQDERLQAYVDGELDCRERLQVARVLAESDDARLYTESLQAQNEALHAAFDRTLSEPLPRRLTSILPDVADTGAQRAAIAGGTAGRRSFWRWCPRAAVYLLVFAVGALGGWFGRGDRHERVLADLTVDTFLRQAANSYSLYSSSESPWSTGGIKDVKKLARWFEGSAGVKLEPPRLDAAGYELTSARVLPSVNGPAGQITYRNDEGKRLAVYFQVSKGGASGGGLPELAKAVPGGSRSYVQRNKLGIYYWDAGALAFALLGNLEEDAMASLARRAGLIEG